MDPFGSGMGRGWLVKEHRDLDITQWKTVNSVTRLKHGV